MVPVSLSMGVQPCMLWARPRCMFVAELRSYRRLLRVSCEPLNDFSVLREAGEQSCPVSKLKVGKIKAGRHCTSDK